MRLALLVVIISPVIVGACAASAASVLRPLLRESEAAELRHFFAAAARELLLGEPEGGGAKAGCRQFAKKGKALLFNNIKGNKYRATSNLFGTLERSRYMFRDSLNIVKKI